VLGELVVERRVEARQLIVEGQPAPRDVVRPVETVLPVALGLYCCTRPGGCKYTAPTVKVSVLGIIVAFIDAL